MPKKSKTDVNTSECYGFIKKIFFTNFRLLDKDEIVFGSGSNLIFCASLIEKTLLKSFFKVCFNYGTDPKFKKLGINIFNLIKTNENDLNRKISFGFVFNLNFEKNKLDFIEFIMKFTNNGEMKVEYSINKELEIMMRVFHWNENKFVDATPAIEYYVAQTIKKVTFQNNLFVPYFDQQEMFKITQLSSVELFDFTLQILGLQGTVIKYFDLTERLNLLKLEREHFTNLKEHALERKDDLENDLKIIEKINSINSQIIELNLEKNWSNYFDLKNKFESKSANFKQIKEKIDISISEKNRLETTLDKVTNELDDSRIQLEEVTNDYENKRKNFLSEKASIDKIDRSLKDWNNSISKTEKDFKFKTMKLADKEKKLKDIETRLNKDKSDTLLNQKNQIESEIKKDKTELATLQQRLDAVNNEKNLKLKEKNIKERNIQPLSLNITELSTKISSLSESIAQKEKEHTFTKESLNSNEKNQFEFKNQLEILENEIKILITDIAQEETTLKGINSKKPTLNRSYSTLNILINQQELEKSKLIANIDPKTNEETYSKHLSLIEQLSSEITQRDDQLNQLDELINKWRTQWELILNENFERINKLTNDLLENYNVWTNLSLSKTLIPAEGALNISFNLNKENSEVNFSLSTSSYHAIIIIFAFILASIYMSNGYFFIFDLLDFNFLNEKVLIKFLESFDKKFEISGQNGEILNTQIIFFSNESIQQNLPKLESLIVIK